VNKSLKEKLEATFKDIRIAVSGDSRIAVSAESGSVLAILRFLKDAGLNHLALLSAVDWIEEGCFELCFILTSYMQNNDEVTDRQRLHIILKTRIPREKPQFKTATGIFPNAEPYEREIHELFGIKFEGHKRLTPLLLEREYEIPPFRKDFDTRKYVEDVFGNIPSVEDNK
jgi:NADH-quinone oxidoreductase subunit C